DLGDADTIVSVKCRHCGADLSHVLVDLGVAPPSNAYLTKMALKRPEKFFPLRVLVCESCWLVQAEAYSRAAELFNEEYAYFSSFSSEWLAHAKKYVDEMVERFGLSQSSVVGEVAANDGYLLQFVKERGISCYGIEPTASTANAARQNGVEIVQDFLNVSLAGELRRQNRTVNLLAANNVLAHVPDINDFSQACQMLLKENGVFTCEFPHLLNLISQHQFDTIYHEHFSYLSFGTVVNIFAKNGLSVFDVEKLGTHGGSLRVFAQRSDTGSHQLSVRVEELISEENNAGMTTIDFYRGFQEHAEKVKNDFLRFLIEKKSQGKLVVGYGAAAKGNTLLNFAGVKSDLIKYVVDRSPHKQGKFMPGSRIPIVSEDRLASDRPDFVVVFPWNIFEEITAQFSMQENSKFQLVAPN
ncbi:MAG: methyltransferase domain-containing protein, partial [Acidimicrobiaceae bacterium]